MRYARNLWSSEMIIGNLPVLNTRFERLKQSDIYMEVSTKGGGSFEVFEVDKGAARSTRDRPLPERLKISNFDVILA